MNESCCCGTWCPAPPEEMAVHKTRPQKCGWKAEQKRHLACQHFNIFFLPSLKSNNVIYLFDKNFTSHTGTCTCAQI